MCPSCDGMGATYSDHSGPGVTCEECRGGGVVEAPPVEWCGIPVLVVAGWDPAGVVGVAREGVVEGYVCKCGRSHIINGAARTECPCGAVHLHDTSLDVESLLAAGFVEITCPACIDDTATGHTMGADCARIPF